MFSFGMHSEYRKASQESCGWFGGGGGGVVIFFRNGSFEIKNQADKSAVRYSIATNGTIKTRNWIFCYLIFPSSYWLT